MRMTSYYDFIKPILFKMDAERAHELVRKVLKFNLNFMKFNSELLNTKIKELMLENPLALAAGFDKNAEIVTFLSSLGFGYITLGSVLLKPNKGNPRPRIVRYPKLKSMTNSMGLPSVGIEKFIENLKKQRKFSPISISIAGNTIEEIKELYLKASKYAEIIEINLSCPNTENGRLFQEIDNFDKLSREISEIKNRITFVKISPPANKKDIENHLELADLCIKRNIDGVTAINTLQVKDENLATKQGGLSGKLIFNLMLNTVKILYKETRGKIIINACGGIFDWKDAVLAMMHGANTFQIYTALIYEGISINKSILKGINNFLMKNKFSNINEIVGYKVK
jgi:dihydroorotate dehydrogenase